MKMCNLPKSYQPAPLPTFASDIGHIQRYQNDSEQDPSIPEFEIDNVLVGLISFYYSSNNDTPSKRSKVEIVAKNVRSLSATPPASDEGYRSLSGKNQTFSRQGIATEVAAIFEHENQLEHALAQDSNCYQSLDESTTATIPVEENSLYRYCNIESSSTNGSFYFIDSMPSNPTFSNTDSNPSIASTHAQIDALLATLCASLVPPITYTPMAESHSKVIPGRPSTYPVKQRGCFVADAVYPHQLPYQAPRSRRISMPSPSGISDKIETNLSSIMTSNDTARLCACTQDIDRSSQLVVKHTSSLTISENGDGSRKVPKFKLSLHALIRAIILKFTG
jgi:hypothetical protein